jgi:DNA polymerase III subunit epsilon
VRILWLDVETTGLDKTKNGIIQIAGIVDIDGEAVETFNFAMNPEKEIDPGAQAIHGITPQEIIGFPSRETTFQDFVSLLDRYVDGADRGTRFHPGGYNVRFDLDFLEQWFREMRSASLYGYVCHEKVDPSIMMKAFQSYLGKARLPSWSLRAVASSLGVDLGHHHDALEDIRFTREIHRRLQDFFGER